MSFSSTRLSMTASILTRASGRNKRLTLAQSRSIASSFSTVAQSRTVSPTLTFKPTSSPFAILSSSQPSRLGSGSGSGSGFSLSRVSSRFNSTSTSSRSQDQQLYSSFSTPFSQFLYTISRIARILLFSSLSIVTILAITFESTHQYLEHFRIKNPSIAADPTSISDPYGFQYEHSSESACNQWTGSPGKCGTDSRLSSKVKHAIRSAWVCLNWGAGINPIYYFNSPGGLLGPNWTDSYASPTGSTTGAGPAENQEEGLKFAETYLKFALKKCEDAGYQIPEIGIPFHLNQVDETALKLEIQLANVRERLGTRNSILNSIVGYEKVFQVLMTRHESQDQSRIQDVDDESKSGSEKRAKSDSNQKSNLVSLATKLGRLHAEVQDRESAEHWLLKAIDISGSGLKRSSGTSTPTPLEKRELEAVALQDQSEQKSSWIPNRFGGSTGTSGNTSGNDSSGPAESQAVAPSIPTSPSPSPSPPPVSAIIPLAQTSTPTSTSASIRPTPALTRSLISALLTLSGLYASSQTDKKASLEKAIKIQSDAFSICRLEKERLLSLKQSSPSSTRPDPPGTSKDQELHDLWLTLNSSIISLHLAQTLYGLSKLSNRSSFLNILPTSSSSPSSSLPTELTRELSKNPVEKSRRWLENAQLNSRIVKSELVTRKLGLEKRWEESEDYIEVMARRLARDSLRVEEMSQELLNWLKTKEKVQG